MRVDEEEIIPKHIIKCSKDKKSIHACFSENCKFYPFICSDEDCECQKPHEDCSVLMTGKLEKTIRKKIMTLKPLEDKIEKFFEESIDKLSNMRDKLLEKLKTKIEDYSGLSDTECKVLKALDIHKLEELNGNDLWEIQFHLNDKSESTLKLENKFRQIEKTLCKFDVEITKLNEVLKNEVENLNEGTSWDSKIILNGDQQRTIKEFFENKEIKSMDLLYRGTENGFECSKFHEQCDEISQTLIICETEYGKVIGGYTPLVWRTNNQYQSDSTMSTFLFSLTNKHKFLPLSYDNITLGHPTKGPYFSNYGDFAISNKAHENPCYSNICNIFLNENYTRNNPTSFQLLSGSETNKFKLKEWEVFKVQFV